MSKNHTGDKLTLSVILIVLISLFQTTIITLPDDQYWKIYDTSNDVLINALSIALFNAIPYSHVQLKSVAAALVAWFIYVSFSNVMTDYDFLPVDDSTLTAMFMTMVIVIVYAFRFVFNWSHHKIPVYNDKLYLVTGKPTNLSQLSVAIYTGVGGAFGITNGETLWHYSKPANALIIVPLENGYLIGRNIDEICDVSDNHIAFLNSMAGNKFSLLNNCVDLYQLAKKWRIENE